jgi:hypothetical protein
VYLLLVPKKSQKAIIKKITPWGCHGADTEIQDRSSVKAFAPPCKVRGSREGPKTNLSGTNHTDTTQAENQSFPNFFEKLSFRIL